jgi:hypothetical protein
VSIKSADWSIDCGQINIARQSVIAGVTMAQPPRRYLRISLRTLFAVMTICAIWLGYLSKAARDQRLAVRRIHGLGGSVTYDFQFADARRLKNPQPRGWPWLRHLIGPEYFQDVVEVGLDKTQVKDDDLRLVGKLTRLTTLTLNATGVSDAGLKHLGRLKRLRDLGLMETQITGAGLRVVSHFGSLHTLNLQNSHGVDDDVFEHLKSLNHLVMLSLGGTSVTSAGVSQLTTLQNLKSFDLSNTSVDDAVAEALIDVPHLEELWLTGTQISGEGLLKIRTDLPSCNIDCDEMDLSEDTLFIGNKWAQLAARLSALNEEGRLRLVDLSDTQMTDENLRSLYSLDRVEVIDLRNTNVSTAGVKRLENALPGCKCLQ